MDVVELKQKYEEAIELLAQDDSEASLDAREFVRIQKMFRKQLAKARLAEQMHRRKTRLMRSAQVLVGAGDLSSTESLLLNAMDVVISFINLIALPITLPLSMAAVAVQNVQDTLKPRKPTSAERAALRNDLIRQLWLLSKRVKDDTEEIRKANQFLLEAKQHYIKALNGSRVITEERKRKRKDLAGANLGAYRAQANVNSDMQV
jgi:hypothetical protein